MIENFLVSLIQAGERLTGCRWEETEFDCALILFFLIMLVGVVILERILKRKEKKDDI